MGVCVVFCCYFFFFCSFVFYVFQSDLHGKQVSNTIEEVRRLRVNLTIQRIGRFVRDLRFSSSYNVPFRPSNKGESSFVIKLRIRS